ncbi:YcxB family protein [Bradyrhizobium sp.]|uniref:YcxB family protein n=1 Tax=Bradyrhizobium sp. TaxID=376 RepID=UPI003C717B72
MTAVKKHLAGMLNAFEAKTAIFDATGVTVTGQISETKWRWAAISRVTCEREFFLVWIGGSSALVIPRRSFASPTARLTAEAFIRARLLAAGSSSTARR